MKKSVKSSLPSLEPQMYRSSQDLYLEDEIPTMMSPVTVQAPLTPTSPQFRRVDWQPRLDTVFSSPEGASPDGSPRRTAKQPKQRAEAELMIAGELKQQEFIVELPTDRPAERHRSERSISLEPVFPSQEILIPKETSRKDSSPSFLSEKHRSVEHLNVEGRLQEQEFVVALPERPAETFVSQRHRSERSISVDRVPDVVEFTATYRYSLSACSMQRQIS